MSKAKDAAFYRSLREHLIKIVEYVMVLEKRTLHIEDEFDCIKENLKHIEYKLDSYLNYKQLTEYLLSVQNEEDDD